MLKKLLTLICAALVAAGLTACGDAGEDCLKGSFGSDARACKNG